MSFSSTVNLSSLNGTTGFRLNGVTNGDSSGISVASAGDVNGDGFADVIVGAYLADPNGSSSGASYVVFGNSSGWSSSVNLSTLNGTTGFRLEGASADDRSGFSVASAGDVNGDGFADLIVSAQGADPNGGNSGSSYVVFGKASGWDSTINLSTLNGTTGFRLDGVAAGDGSSNSVASAGDVNGDGFADLIVGAYQADPGVSDSGSSYVVFGKANGWNSTINLSTLNGTTGFRLDGSVLEGSGYSVASAGDVNGDGFADLIVGAIFAAPNGSASGSSYVVFGKSSGWNSSVNLSSLNGSTGFRLDGVSANDQSGYSVASAGDVNGDGYGDVIVGAFQADPNGGDSGSSYVVFGMSGGWSSTINLSTLNGTTGFRLDGVAASHNSGKAVASAGDVDGDGFADLIVGAPGANPNGVFLAGASYIVFGRSAGWSASTNLSTLNGTTGFRLDGVGVVNLAGVSGASAGDVDGDGFADLIVGANNAAPNGSGSGATYVYFSPDTGAATYRGTSLSDVLRGTPGNDVMNGNGQNDKLFGNAGNDTINGGAGDDTVEGGAGNDSLDGGAGNDTLTYASATGNITLSLAVTTAQPTGGAGTDVVSNFENLTGGAGNDSLTGDGGNNVLLGGAGNDTIQGGDGNDTIEGGAGDDSLDGGAGIDTLSYASSRTGVAIVLSLSDQGVDDGTDTVSGFENILGGTGNDTLLGDGGNNVIQGGAGNDSLSGEAGDDTIEGGAGDDTLRGFGGTDTLTYASATAGITVSLALTTAQNTGGAGTDTLSAFENLLGGAGNDSLTGSTAANAITGAGGDDTIDGGAGNDTLDGGVGIDTLIYASAITGITVSLALTSAQNTGGAGTDTVSNFENLTGGLGNDSLTGDAGNNRITGGLGNDSIDGAAGNDTALLSGTQGAYRFGVRDGVAITSGADGLDRFINVESFQWGNTAAVSIASLQSAPGNTGLVFAKLGDAAADYVLPDAYSGPVTGLANQLLGGTGNDIMLGTGFGDFLNGGAGDDALDGGAGNDVIDGGLGSNFLTGGAGRDIFFVDGRGAATANTWSTITDYTAGEQVTIWGFRPGVSNSIWVADDGVGSYKGATMHWDLDGNGRIDTSVTFTGLTQAALPTPTFGVVGGQDYILFG